MKKKWFCKDLDISGNVLLGKWERVHVKFWAEQSRKR